MDFSLSGWQVPLVATVVFYGLAQALTKQFMANVSAGAFILLYVFLKVVVNAGAILVWPHQPFWGGQGSNTFLVWGLVSGAFIAGAWLFYYLALESGKVALVGTVTAAFPVVTVILAGVFIGDAERLIPLQYVGIALIIGVAALMAYQPEAKAEAAPEPGGAVAVAPAKPSRRWLWLSLIVVALWGTGSYFSKVAYMVPPEVVAADGSAAGWDANYLLANLVAVVAILAPYGLLATRGKLGPPRDLALALIPTALFVLGDVTLFRAWATGPVSIVTPLSGLYPVVTLLYVVPVLKEQLTGSQKLALVMTFVAILLVVANTWLPELTRNA
ncbi:MAG: EamA family transporter [Candidatus Sericytochromatia bacterium]|nr:EamA family transporter [Candidatus Tanganyikabacteria bacterium]